MSNPKVVKPTNFDSKLVEFSEPRTKKNKDGVEKLISFIRYDGKPMWLETPWCRAPFGVSSFNKGDTGNIDWSVNFSAQSSGLDTDEDINSFFNQLRGMEDRLVEFGVTYSKTIFGEEHPAAIVRVLFNSFVKQDKEKKYAARISPKIPRLRSREDEDAVDRPYIEFFRGSEEPVELDSFEQLASFVPKGSCVRALIAPRLYFVSGKFGVSWDVISMKAQSSSTSRPTGLTAFSDESPEEFVTRNQKAIEAAKAAKAAEAADGAEAAEAADGAEKASEEASEASEADEENDSSDEEEA